MKESGSSLRENGYLLCAVGLYRVLHIGHTAKRSLPCAAHGKKTTNVVVAQKIHDNVGHGKDGCTAKTTQLRQVFTVCLHTVKIYFLLCVDILCRVFAYGKDQRFFSEYLIIGRPESGKSIDAM